MGSGGLDGLRAKVGRAEELLDEAVREVGAWFERYENPLIIERDHQMNLDRFVWNVPDKPPSRVSLLVGDAIHNLRASLDYIVWELSVSSRRVPEHHKRDISWPVCRDPARWPGRAAQSLRYVEPAAQAVIEDLQPYSRPGRFLVPYGGAIPEDLTQYDFLVALQGWDNIGKHRSLHTMGVASLGGFSANTYGGRFEVFYPSTVEYGTEIAAILYPWGKSPTHPEAEVNAEFPLDVAIREPPLTWGMQASLGLILNNIRSEIVPAFDPFF